jgi:hypothetical protein
VRVEFGSQLGRPVDASAHSVTHADGSSKLFTVHFLQWYFYMGTWRMRGCAAWTLFTVHFLQYTFTVNFETLETIAPCAHTKLRSEPKHPLALTVLVRYQLNRMDASPSHNADDELREKRALVPIPMSRLEQFKSGVSLSLISKKLSG